MVLLRTNLGDTKNGKRVFSATLLGEDGGTAVVKFFSGAAEAASPKVQAGKVYSLTGGANRPSIPAFNCSTTSRELLFFDGNPTITELSPSEAPGLHEKSIRNRCRTTSFANMVQERMYMVVGMVYTGPTRDQRDTNKMAMEVVQNGVWITVYASEPLATAIMDRYETAAATSGEGKPVPVFMTHVRCRAHPGTLSKVLYCTDETIVRFNVALDDVDKLCKDEEEPPCQRARTDLPGDWPLASIKNVLAGRVPNKTFVVLGHFLGLTLSEDSLRMRCPGGYMGHYLTELDTADDDSSNTHMCTLCGDVKATTRLSSRVSIVGLGQMDSLDCQLSSDAHEHIFGMTASQIQPILSDAAATKRMTEDAMARDWYCLVWSKGDSRIILAAQAMPESSRCSSRSTPSTLFAPASQEMPSCFD